MSEFTITLFDRDRTFEVKIDDLILISLEAELSYKWELVAVNNKIIEFLNLDKPQPDKKDVGAFPKHNFLFRAKSLGTTQIQLKRLRHWEKSLDKAIEHFKIKIQVNRSTNTSHEHQ
ncbi:MAG: protease inhibitor I42 family protein [Crocosphaera sp.]|jgi:inhibitor of cysteine peptidase